MCFFPSPSPMQINRTDCARIAFYSSWCVFLFACIHLISVDWMRLGLGCYQYSDIVRKFKRSKTKAKSQSMTALGSKQWKIAAATALNRNGKQTNARISFFRSHSPKLKSIRIKVSILFSSPKKFICMQMSWGMRERYWELFSSRFFCLSQSFINRKNVGCVFFGVLFFVRPSSCVVRTHSTHTDDCQFHTAAFFRLLCNFAKRCDGLMGTQSENPAIHRHAISKHQEHQKQKQQAYKRAYPTECRCNVQCRLCCGGTKKFCASFPFVPHLQFLFY